MKSGRRALRYATDTGRASSRAGAGKVEEVPRAQGLVHATNVPAGPRICQASYLSRLVTRPLPLTGPLLLFSLLASPGFAQGLPSYAPINPVADSRTVLGFEPY